MKQKSPIWQIFIIFLFCSCYGFPLRQQAKKTLAYVEVPKYRFDSKPHGEVLTYPPEEDLKDILTTRDSDAYFQKLFASKHFKQERDFIENIKIYEDFNEIFIVQIPNKPKKMQNSPQ